MTVIFYDTTFYCTLTDASEEQALVDTLFPNIYGRQHGMQVRARCGNSLQPRPSEPVMRRKSSSASSSPRCAGPCVRPPQVPEALRVGGERPVSGCLS
jgi:hypothetical protein